MQRPVKGRTTSKGLTPSDWVQVILALISGAWGLIAGAATIIIVVIGGIAIISNITASATLTEHSSCQQFEQASSDAENKVLQEMMASHHDTSSVQEARFSLNLYCNVEGPSAPIDGIYGRGSVGTQPVAALDIRSPLTTARNSSQAWQLVAAKP